MWPLWPNYLHKYGDLPYLCNGLTLTTICSGNACQGTLCGLSRGVWLHSPARPRDPAFAKPSIYMAGARRRHSPSGPYHQIIPPSIAHRLHRFNRFAPFYDVIESVDCIEPTQSSRQSILRFMRRFAAAPMSAIESNRLDPSVRQLPDSLSPIMLKTSPSHSSTHL